MRTKSPILLLKASTRNRSDRQCLWPTFHLIWFCFVLLFRFAVGRQLETMNQETSAGPRRVVLYMTSIPPTQHPNHRPKKQSCPRLAEPASECIEGTYPSPGEQLPTGVWMTGSQVQHQNLPSMGDNGSWKLLPWTPWGRPHTSLLHTFT